MTDKSRISWKAAGIAGVLLIAALLRVYLYWMGATFIPVTTDEALTVLQALDVRAGAFPLLLSAQPYMFPLEAYWMAPFVEMLPRTAFGMRSLALAEGVVFVALSLLVLRRTGSWRDNWPAALLILFPSVYLVMNQTAYSLPHNNSAYILVLAAAWCILSLNRAPGKYDILIAAAGGFFAVLAFSNAMLSISLVVPLLVVAAWHCVGRGHWVRLPGYLIGSAIGIIPHVAAIATIPGAHQSVTATHEIGRAMTRWWFPTISQTLPVTFGMTPTLFPDQSERLAWGEWGHILFPYLFTGLILAATAISLFTLIDSCRRKRRHYLGAREIALGASVLCCLLFMMSKRADSGSYRYLGPLLVVFPFLFAGVMNAFPRAIRSAFAVVALALVAFNAAVSVRLPLEWQVPGFARNVVAAPNLNLALDVLAAEGIDHCYASHWAAYRIPFESAGVVTCSQPYNERFGGWHLPYKKSVDASTNAAYVLTDYVRFLKPELFERHLSLMDVQCDIKTAGHFRIYYNFVSPLYASSARIESDLFSITAAEMPENIALMTDGTTKTFWRSEQLQHTNQWVQLDFAQPVLAPFVVLKYGRHDHDRARMIRVLTYDGDKWSVHMEASNPSLDKFSWLNNKPVYGGSQRTFQLGTSYVSAVRFEIAEDNPDWAWTIAEAEVYGQRE